MTAIRRGDLEQVTVPIRWRRGAVLKVMAGRTVSRVLRDTEGNPFTTRVVSIPREVEGPIRRGQPLGVIEVRAHGKRVATVPLVAANAVPKADFGQQTKEWFTHPARSLLLAAVLAGSVLLARRGRQVHRRRRRPRGGAGGRMILTVTLNTAIDKTLAVPNFRLGRRHRTVEQTSMPGGKGVNVARVLKTLGQPVIATGLAGGPTGTRIVEQLTHVSVLSDFVRIREESRTNTAVIDPTNGEQTEINERGPSVSEQEVELFVDKLLYLAKGAKWCVFAGSLPRNVDVDVYARLIRELRRLGVVCVVDTDGDPLRRAVRAEPDVISPNVLEAEELVGHEFNDPEDHVIAVREMLELGAREAVMTMPDGCYAMLRPEEPQAGRRSTACECRRVGSSRAPRSARATRSWPASSPRATAASPTEEALVYGVACGAESTQHLGAGLVDPGAGRRLLADVVVEHPALPAEQSV